MQEENKVKKGFFQNMKAELKKVIWPTGKQVTKNTFATIVFVLLIAVILGVFNLLFNALKTGWFNLIFPSNSVSNEGATTTQVSGEVLELESGDEGIETSTEGNEEEEGVEESQIVEEQETSENAQESVVTE